MEVVAKLQWQGADVASGKTEGGLALISLADVQIVTREITKGHQTFSQRMREATHKPSPEDIKRIRQEIREDPSRNEVVGVWYIKSIQLSPSYYFSYSEYPARDDEIGFGFSSGLGEMPEDPGCRLTFSWDWFNVSEPGMAEKLQENGQLSFEIADTASGREMTHVVFQSDVSFRIFKDPVDIERPDWRITISQGSEIYWPWLADGQLVASGSVETD